MTGWAATAWKTLITTSAFPQRPRCYPADLLQRGEGETNTKRSDLFMCFKSLLLQLRASGLIFKPRADFCFCRWSFEGPAGASGGQRGPQWVLWSRSRGDHSRAWERERERLEPGNPVTWWETQSAGEQSPNVHRYKVISGNVSPGGDGFKYLHQRKSSSSLLIYIHSFRSRLTEIDLIFCSQRLSVSTWYDLPSAFLSDTKMRRMRCLMEAWRLIVLPGPLDACPGTVLNHFLPGSISGLGMMWVIFFGSVSLETSSPASSLQQMVTDWACKVVRLAAIAAHRTASLFLPVNTGVFRQTL